MLNVLSLVSYQFLPAKMGGQKCIAFGNKYLAKIANVICVSTANNAYNEDLNYNILKILSNSKLRYINIFYFFRLKKIIKQNQITHLIIEHPYYGWLAILLKLFCGVKLIVRSHNIESIRFKSINKWWWRILWYYEKFVHKNADCSFFITQDDKDFAISNFKLKPNKTEVITYGFELETIPNKALRKEASGKIKQKHNINENDIIILFNGGLDYKPNKDALNNIINKINPILLNYQDFKYKIIICGKNLPVEYNNLKPYLSKNIVYAGFVNNIEEYYLGSDIFINPVIDGGGIKTKIVEALGFNLSLVTTKSGAIGINSSFTGKKMIIVNDNNWDDFAKSIIKINIQNDTPTDYFTHFSWTHISLKITSKLEQIKNNE